MEAAGSVLDEAELLDRDEDMSSLAQLAANARSGQGGVVCVEGRAGAGKTSLLNAWATVEQNRDITVVHTVGTELQSGLAFSIVRHLFGPRLAVLSGPDEEAVFRGPAELARQALETEVQQAAAVGDLSLGPVYGLYWLTLNLADRGPMLIIVDDAQWADLPSLHWLQYLARRLDGVPVALALSVRTGEAYETSELLSTIATQPACGHIHLKPLARASVARLVRRRMGGGAAAEFCDACAESSEGNPMLLNELLRTLVDNGVAPDAGHARLVAEFRGQVLAKTLVERLHRLPEAGIRLAQALAVLDDDPPPHLVAVLADMTETQVGSFARRLRGLGMLQPGSLLRFSHPLVRTAVTESISIEELAGRHVRAAHLYHEEGAPPEVIASHLLLTRPTELSWAADTLRNAARVARGRGAPGIAARYLRRALREQLVVPARLPVLLELGTCELFTAPDAAAHHLRQAISMQPDPLARGQVASMLASALMLARRGPEAVEVLTHTIGDIPDGDLSRPATGPARELRMLLEAQLIQIGYEEMSTVPVVAKRVRQLRPLAPSVFGATPGERALLAALTIHAMAGNASAVQTAELADRAFSGGSQPSGATAVLFTLASFNFILCDRLAEAAEWHRAMAEAAIRSSSPRLHFYALGGKVAVAARQGALTEAIVSGRAWLDLAADEFGYSSLPMAGLVASAMIDAGEPDAAQELLTTYSQHDAPEATWDRGLYLLTRGRLRLAQGQTAAALTALLECGRHQDAAGIVNPALTPWRSQAALAHASLGHVSEAVELAEQELDLSRRWGTPRCIGVSLRCLGLVKGGREGTELLAEAAAELERSPARTELARTLADLGVALVGDGRRETGQETLRRGLGLAEQCGANGLASHIRDALRGTGARPRRPRTTGHPVLTPSEYQVASKAALGQTNREIAQALFVTPRTVEIHLASAYRKLGVSGRHQLREALLAAPRLGWLSAPDAG